ncbi:hypothetical protein J2X46_004000 [Nocardioides sp. BE266]|nr:hypothetical protein [Nocardioides sp. BE266]
MLSTLAASGGQSEVKPDEPDDHCDDDTERHPEP